MVAELGKGAFGIVYLVIDRHDSSTDVFAMKTFPQSMIAKSKSLAGRGRSVSSEDAIRMEVSIMKSLVHPNLVSLIEVIDGTSTSNDLYLVLEYITGGPIMRTEEVENECPRFYAPTSSGPYGEETASKLFRYVMIILVNTLIIKLLLCRQVLNAMSYLHSNKIAHRSVIVTIRINDMFDERIALSLLQRFEA